MNFLFPGFRARALTFSYDDGVEQVIRLMQIFDRFRVRATFNLNSGLWSEKGSVYPEGQIHRRMTLAQAVSAYASSPHEIAVHCVSHASLTELTDSEAVRELFMDRLQLEQQFSRPMITGMAYPYGTCNPHTAQLARSCGIRYARTVRSTQRFELPEDFLLWDPTCHHDDPKASELADSFLKTPENRMNLLYIWGHSYEFEAHDNWNQIESLCRRLSGHTDIWYATNGEICDYVTAARQVRFSADGRTIFNPTAVKLYFLSGDKHLMLSSGESMTIS